MSPPLRKIMSQIDDAPKSSLRSFAKESAVLLMTADTELNLYRKKYGHDRELENEAKNIVSAMLPK